MTIEYLETEMRAFLSDKEVNIKVTETPEYFEVEVSQMYEYVFDVSFRTIEALAKIFHSKDFNVNHWSTRGCATCDYGSKYTHIFTIPKDSIHE